MFCFVFISFHFLNWWSQRFLWQTACQDLKPLSSHEDAKCWLLVCQSSCRCFCLWILMSLSCRPGLRGDFRLWGVGRRSFRITVTPSGHMERYRKRHLFIRAADNETSDGWRNTTHDILTREYYVIRMFVWWMSGFQWELWMELVLNNRVEINLISLWISLLMRNHSVINQLLV